MNISLSKGQWEEHTQATGNSTSDSRDSLNLSPISWGQKSAPESVLQATDLGKKASDDGEPSITRGLQIHFSPLLCFSSLGLRKTDRGGQIPREHRQNES